MGDDELRCTRQSFKELLIIKGNINGIGKNLNFWRKFQPKSFGSVLFKIEESNTVDVTSDIRAGSVMNSKKLVEILNEKKMVR